MSFVIFDVVILILLLLTAWKGYRRGFVLTLCWSAFGSVFRRLFSQHAKTINTVMALLLVYCAVSLFLA